MPTRAYVKRKLKKYLRKARAARRRIPRSIAPQMKHYNYTFKLTPQVITTDANGAVVVFGGGGSEPGAGNPQLPNVPMVPNTGGSGTPNGDILSSVTLSGLTGADFQAACSFALSDVASSGVFAAMYDAYRITKIDIDMEYLSNVSFSGTTVVSNAFLPTFWHYWDPDDAVVPPNLRAMLGKQGVKRWQPNATRTTKRFSFRPRNNVSLQASSTSGSGTSNAIVPNKSNWIDCVNPNVPHYAFKLAGTEFPGGLKQAALRLNYTYHVSFRGPLICS